MAKAHMSGFILLDELTVTKYNTTGQTATDQRYLSK